MSFNYKVYKIKIIIIIIIIMGGSYIAHFTNASMRFTTSGGLFRAAYNGALAAEQLTIMRN
jgi:DNA-binding transcriptional regulator of glucitol operon